MAKYSPMTTAGELQKIVESQGQKTFLFLNQTSPSSPHVFCEGFNKKTPRSSKTNLQHIQLSDTTGTSNGTGFCCQIKQTKKSFLAATPTAGFSKNRDKKYNACPRLNIQHNIVDLFFCQRSWTSCLDTWHHGFYQIPTDKNLNLTASVRNLIMGQVWIFQQDNNPKQTSKSTQKMSH